MTFGRLRYFDTEFPEYSCIATWFTDGFTSTSEQTSQRFAVKLYVGARLWKWAMHELKLKLHDLTNAKSSVHKDPTEVRSHRCVVQAIPKSFGPSSSSSNFLIAYALNVRPCQLHYGRRTLLNVYLALVILDVQCLAHSMTHMCSCITCRSMMEHQCLILSAHSPRDSADWAWCFPLDVFGYTGTSRVPLCEGRRHSGAFWELHHGVHKVIRKLHRGGIWEPPLGKAYIQM